MEEMNHGVEGADSQSINTSPNALDDFITPEIFQIHGRKIIKKLLLLPHPTSSVKKLIPESYKRFEWPVLSSQQRKKVVDVWNNALNEVQRTAIIASINSDLEKEARQRATQVNNHNGAEVDPGARAANTNIHDRARVLHLFFDPLLIENWSNALRVMERSELDDHENPPDDHGKIE
jgi:hypothetical protein